MSYLVRKISRSKWEVDGSGPINADAITNCLKTTGNTLSFWQVTSENEISDAVLALAAANDNLDKMDVVVIHEDIFRELAITIAESPGKTACEKLAHTHRDLANLSINELASIADVLAGKIREGKTTRFTLSKLRTLLLSAIDEGRLDFERLSDGIKKKLQPRPPTEPCPTCGAVKQ